MTKLRAPRTLSPTVLTFLDQHIRTREDLYSETALKLCSELQSQCSDLNRTISSLASQLESSLLSFSSSSDTATSSFDNLNSLLSQLGSVTSNKLGKMGLGEELPDLAREVSRLETVRSYAEAALKLVVLVGEIEDYSSSILSKKDTNHSKQTAIEALARIESELSAISRTRPRWRHLLLATNERIDRAFSIIRPHAISEYRNLLASLKWPPSPPTSSPFTNQKLFTSSTTLPNQYHHSFLSLCQLQRIQIQRKSYRSPLWAIEELAKPMFISCKEKLVKWKDNPEFIFALILKICRDYLPIMDETLQPIVDEARLVDYSCREEWISSFTTNLSSFLGEELFPLCKDSNFLQLVELMINFDNQILTLLSFYTILEDDGKFSSFFYLSKKDEWVDFWTKLEADNAVEKLKHAMSDDKHWKGKDFKSDGEEFDSRAVSGACLKLISSVIDRGKFIPAKSSRERFHVAVGVAIIRVFLEGARTRCEEAEGLTALTDNEGLVKVTRCVNALREVESALRKWCLMEVIDDVAFGDEIENVERVRKEWVEKLTVVILRGFESKTREYFKNRKWLSRDGGAVASGLVEPLGYIEWKMGVIEGSLNQMDFVTVWRRLAFGIDGLFYNGIFVGSLKLDDVVLERLCGDLNAVFGVFRAWCLRPESFFPKIRDALKLLISPNVTN